jgi:hypothetical protein
MKTNPQLPAVIASYLRSINARDAAAFQSSFTENAVVKDVGREVRGVAAIADWANTDIFAVNVSLELMDTKERDGQFIITVKVDGTFDRTGLPDPLMMEHCFVLAGDRIASLTCRLAETKPS